MPCYSQIERWLAAKGGGSVANLSVRVGMTFDMRRLWAGVIGLGMIGTLNGRGGRGYACR